jgi:cell division septation protein DedD
MRPGKSAAGLLILLVVLAAAAVGAAYFLFSANAFRFTVKELTAEIDPRTGKARPSSRINHSFTPEEKEAIARAASTPEATTEPSISAPAPAQEPQPAQPDAGQSAPPAVSSSGPAPAALPAAEPAPAKPQPPAGALKPPPRSGEIWVINALSTQDGEKARQVLDRMIKLPYFVYSYPVEIKGVNWHRIRIGFFASQAEAERTGVKLAREFELPPPWLLKPSSQEIDQYYPR